MQFDRLLQHYSEKYEILRLVIDAIHMSSFWHHLSDAILPKNVTMKLSSGFYSVVNVDSFSSDLKIFLICRVVLPLLYSPTAGEMILRSEKFA